MIDPYLLDPKKKLDDYLNERNDFDKKIVEYSNEDIEVGRLTSDKKTTFLDFIDDMRGLWVKQGEDLCNIVRAFPNDKEAELDIITFRLINRKINQEFKDYKPRLRTTLPHPHREKETIQVYAQVFDLLVEFKVLTSTAEKADMLVTEFDDFIQRYTGHFKQAGVQEILFVQQLEDQVNTFNRIEKHMRPLQYNIRLERLTVKYENELEHISLQAKIYNKNK